MTRKLKASDKSEHERWYRGADIPRSLIRRFARQVAERFQPEKIILFGSYAYGSAPVFMTGFVSTASRALRSISKHCFGLAKP
jgi:hypothetical protein